MIDRGGFDRIDANLQKEVYLTAKGHDYITLFVDLYQKAVVHIRSSKLLSVNSHLSYQIHPYQTG